MFAKIKFAKIRWACFARPNSQKNGRVRQENAQIAEKWHFSDSGGEKIGFLKHFVDLAKHFRDILKHFVDLAKHFRDISKHFVDLLKHLRDILKHFVDLAKHF